MVYEFIEHGCPMKRGKLIAVANTKGGVGKSTIAGNLAWAIAQEQSQSRVLLVDADSQASVTKWFDLSESDLPFDRQQLSTARSLQSQLPRLRVSYDFIIVDCPPMQSDVTAAAVTSADLALVPVQPSPLDVLAYSQLVPLLRQAQASNERLRLRFVVNQLMPRTVLAREVQESLAESEIPVSPAHIHTRQIYRRAVQYGGAVVLDEGPARDEVNALMQDVLNVLSEEASA